MEIKDGGKIRWKTLNLDEGFFDKQDDENNYKEIKNQVGGLLKVEFLRARCWLQLCLQ